MRCVENLGRGCALDWVIYGFHSERSKRAIRVSGATARPYICHLHHRNTQCRVSGNMAFAQKYEVFYIRVSSLVTGINNTRSDQPERTSISTVGDFFGGRNWGPSVFPIWVTYNFFPCADHELSETAMSLKSLIYKGPCQPPHLALYPTKDKNPSSIPRLRRISFPNYNILSITSHSFHARCV